MYLRKPKTMKVRTFTSRLIQLNNCLPYFPPDHVGQMVTALSNDEVKEILYHAMSNSWRKKMTEQGYNYLDRYIQELSGFFETRVENLETPAPERSLTRKKKKKNSKRQKAVSFEEFDEDSSDDENPQAGRNSVSIMENAVILQTNVLHSRP